MKCDCCWLATVPVREVAPELLCEECYVYCAHTPGRGQYEPEDPEWEADALGLAAEWQALQPLTGMVE